MPRTPCLALILLAGTASANPPEDHELTRYADALAHQPTPIPDRIVTTFAGDPATSFAVTWRTDTSVTKAFAQIAPPRPAPASTTPAPRSAPTRPKSPTCPPRPNS